MKLLRKCIVFILILILCSTFFSLGCVGEDGAQGGAFEQIIQGEQGEKGEKGDTGATGTIGPQGPQGQPGPIGPQGPSGTNGSNGADGSVWHTGFTVPLDSVGKNTDMYLDTTSRDIYQKTNGTWNMVGNMQGKQIKQKWNADNSLKILAIGNSFSDDALWLLPDVLKGLGITNFRISNLYIGGCVLSTHLSNINNRTGAYEFRTNTGSGWSTINNFVLQDAVNADNWDYITIQQGSPESGLADTYNDLPAVLNTVNALKPNAKIMWQMTWAYQQDTNHGAFPTYGNSQTTMYNAIVDAVQTKIVPNIEINSVIPNGTVIQNARTSYLGDTLTRDGYHLSEDIGRYMASLTYAYLTTGYDISAVTFVPNGVTESVKNIAIESVKNAIKMPYNVTASVYTTEPPLPDLSATHTLLSNYGYTDLGFWNSMDGKGRYYSVITGETNSNQWICTRQFTKAELPVGTVIEIAYGYRYRPEGWVGTGQQTSRPNTVTSRRIVIDDAWWGNFDVRAFNVSTITEQDITALTSQIKSAFKIWLPI